MKQNIEFKICLPTGYWVEDPMDDYLDLNILVGDDVYYATLYTVKNVERFLNDRSDSYFWAVDMIIVRDLYVDTIKHAVRDIIAQGYLDEACSRIGSYKEVFSNEYGPADFI